MAPIVALALTILACALVRTSSSSLSDPMPTRTPWPTFTPIATSTPVAMALSSSTDSGSSNPSLPPATLKATRTPLPTFTPSVGDSLAPVPPPASPTIPAAVATPGGTSSPTDVSIAEPTPTPIEVAAPGSTLSPTNTQAAPATEASSPTSMPTATATAAPPPTNTPTATPASPPAPGGWSFAGVRAYADQEAGDLLLYGDMINNTGASQELVFVTGTFYDEQGQVIADEDSTFDYWPVDVIPSGGRVPFELTVFDIQQAANFDLSVEAEPSSETPRQDFEFFDLGQLDQAGDYCVSGRLRNPGAELDEYLVIVAVLFDSQDNVVSFGDEYEPFPEDVQGDEILDFEVCADPLDQQVARYELRAWGQ